MSLKLAARLSSCPVERVGWGVGVAGLVFSTCGCPATFLTCIIFAHFYPFFPLILLLHFFLGKHKFSLSFLTCEISVSLGFV